MRNGLGGDHLEDRNLAGFSLGYNLASVACMRISAAGQPAGEVDHHIADPQVDMLPVEVDIAPVDDLERDIDLLGSMREEYVSGFSFVLHDLYVPGNERSRNQVLVAGVEDTVELVLAHTGAVEDKCRTMAEVVEEVCCNLAALDCTAIAGRTEEFDCTEVAGNFAVGKVVLVKS